MNQIKNTLIIPHFNNLDKLDQCLGALYQYFSNRKDLEIIIVDNGSTRSLIDLKSKYPQTKWLVEKSMRSPYPCRNLGIAHAQGENIILLDSNCIPLENFLNEGLAGISGDCAICGGQLHFLNSRSVASRFDLLYSVIRPGQVEITSLPGTILFIQRRVFVQTGLFLPRVRSLGDIEWTTRAFEAGFQLGITQQPVATYATKELWPFCKKMIRLGRGSKELFVNRGGSLFSWFWTFQLVKFFLPPNPDFVQRMNTRNQEENTQLSIFSLIVFCWLTKILRGLGMLFSGVEGPCVAPILGID